MANVKKNAETGNIVKFYVDFDQKPEKTINVVVYAFDARGRFLASAPLKEGQAELPLDLGALRKLRIYLAPPLERERKTPRLADMEIMHAYQPVFELDPKKLLYKLLPIPWEKWKWWFKCKCRVSGMVVKPVPINGVLVDKGICDARVHICEVDKIWLPILRLPDHLLVKLRDDLIEQMKKPLLVHKPELKVFPWPPPPPERENLFSHPGEAVAFNPQPEPPADPWKLVGLNPQPEPPNPWEIMYLGPQPEPPDIWRLRKSAAMEAFQAGSMTEPAVAVKSPQSNTTSAGSAAQPVFEQLSMETRSGLLASSLPIVRQALVANYKLILPYLCLWPWWAKYFCLYKEIALLTTDYQGRFDTVITYPCFGDHPDLYFWVDYLIDGVWTVVYHPTPVCCHTYWDYVCGSEITLRVTDPRVKWCGPNPDLDNLEVVITSIGNGVSMSEIQKSAGPSQGYTTADEPFAGTLEMRMDLSRSNLINIGVTHYRWSYRRIKMGDGITSVSDSWHPMAHPVYRHYKTLVPNPTPPPALKPYYPADLMGPDPALLGLSLFRIQPVDPPSPGIEWSLLNEHIDMACAYFETASLFEADGTTPAAGQYEVKLELFDSSGNLINWSNPTGSPSPTPIYPFVSSNAAPFTPPIGMTTDPAPAANLITDSSGNVWGYKVVLYIDNNKCQAFIYDTWVDSTTNYAGPCGFIMFADRNTSLANLAFLAYQPFAHAMLRFRVDKGSSGDIPIATAGWDYVNNQYMWASVGSPVNGFSRTSGSVFYKAVLVKDLLDANGFACPQAAFAETLYVYSTAIDGYQRAWWLDAEATPKAFALALTP